MNPVRAIRIDNLDLRLRGIEPSVAQQAADLVGPALARELAGTATSPAHFDRLELDTLRVPAHASALEIAELVAGRAARAIRARIAGGQR